VGGSRRDGGGVEGVAAVGESRAAIWRREMGAANGRAVGFAIDVAGAGPAAAKADQRLPTLLSGFNLSLKPASTARQSAAT